MHQVFLACSNPEYCLLLVGRLSIQTIFYDSLFWCRGELFYVAYVSIVVGILNPDSGIFPFSSEGKLAL
jgi:hypothetical protein